MAESNSHSSEIQSKPSSKSSSPIKKKYGPLCSLEEYLFFKHLSTLTLRPCSVAYLKRPISDLDIKIEYVNLIDFIAKHPQPGRSQLTDILFPIFVHFYLILLQNAGNSEAVNAHKFYMEHANLFLKVEGYEDILNPLWKAKCMNEVRDHASLKKFCDMKFICRASYDVLKDLKVYLVKNESNALLFVLHFHFYYEDETNAEMINFGKINSDEKVEVKNEEPSTIPNESSGIQFFIGSNFHDYFSQIVVKGDIGCSSVDINEDKTEISLALSSISIANIPKEINSSNIFKNGGRRRVCISNENLRTFRDPGQHPKVYAVKYIPFKPDTLLASCGTEVKIINTTTLEVKKTYASLHTYDISDIDINSSATHFVTAGTDMTACLFHLNESIPVLRYEGHTGTVNVVKFHANGIYFATGSSDTTVRLWKIDGTLSQRKFVGHNSEVHNIAFSPNGRMLASADAFGKIIIWDMDKNSKIGEVSVYETEQSDLRRVSSLCFSHDSGTLAASNFKGVLRIWNIKSVSNGNMFPITKYFKNCPILIKCNKDSISWTVVCKEETLGILL